MTKESFNSDIDSIDYLINKHHVESGVITLTIKDGILLQANVEQTIYRRKKNDKQKKEN